MTSKKLVQEFISKIVHEEMDKALVASNKRKKAFKKNFAQVFTEADAAPPPATPPPPDPNTPAPDASGTPAPTDPGATPGGDPNAIPGVGDPATPGTPGAPEDSTEAGAEGDLGGDAGSGGGFGGFGGGGGGGGGTDDTSAPTDSSADEQGPEEKPEGDPIQAMVTGAQELLNQTQDPNLILKSLKGQIQTLFQEPEHALGLVKALYDTQDALLQAVAQRLYLFIKTARAK